MSFVMIGVLNKKLCIVCDTQVTDNDNITVLNNDFKKVKKVGLNCLIGFTGKPGICNLAFEKTDNLAEKLIDPYKLAYVINNNFKTIYSSLNIIKNKQNMCQIVIGGITTDSFYSNNKVFKLYSIDTTVDDINEIQVYDHPEKTIVPMSNLINPKTVQKILINELNNNKKEDTREIFENIVKKVSKYDTTVNDKPFYLEI